MLSYLRNLFRKKKLVTTPASGPFVLHRSGATAQPSQDPLGGNAPMPVPRVETAQLQLLAIVQKFPEELRKLVIKLPPPEAMVALPLPTIQKFLPTGSVKMSLASVVRQSPAGTFAPINTGDKRLVEVPLAEIFKRISPAVLKKREDQRFTDLAADGFDIFGDQENPHVLAPRFDEQPASLSRAVTPPPLSMTTPAPQSQRTLHNPLGNGIVPPPGVGSTHRAPTSAPLSNPALRPPSSEPEELQRVQIIPAGFAGSTTPPPQSSPAIDQPPLVVPVKELAQAWPEPIKSEAFELNGTTVSLPSSYVSMGLARGKVAFAWGQLRGWMSPSPSAPTKADESIELLLPLRVIAPAFLKHTRSGQQKKSMDLDDTIPPLFAPSRASTPPPVAPEAPEAPESHEQHAEPQPAAEQVQPEPQTEPEPQPTEAEAQPLDQPASADIPLVFEEPAPSAPATSDFQIELPADQAPAEEAAVTAETNTSDVCVAPSTNAAVVHNGEAKTLGEAFGEPDKTSWSPSEIIGRLVKIPGVRGAAIALQEGLVIAHELPEPLKGEVFAAFLPQIFARINQYAGEMKLGAVEDLLVQSSSGPCHIFRRGQVFFAALGAAGEPLPSHILRLCADALAE
jgi:predicted regulator of Ras-like GTPase activity (Roadblock/LC7/MglB family)